MLDNIKLSGFYVFVIFISFDASSFDVVIVIKITFLRVSVTILSCRSLLAVCYHEMFYSMGFKVTGCIITFSYIELMTITELMTIRTLIIDYETMRFLQLIQQIYLCSKVEDKW